LEAQPEISNRHYKHVWYYTPDERGISTAMLYNPRYFKLLHATPIRVPLETVGQKRPTRYILFITGVLAGDTVQVLVNHWPSKTGGAAATDAHRKVAADIDKHIVDSLLQKNQGSKIIIMGDFNSNPNEAPISKVLAPVSKKSEVTLTDLYNPFISLYNDGKGTESYQGEWNMIDQIMVSGGFVKNPNNKWKYHDCEIFVRSYLTYSIGYHKGLPHRSFTVNHVWDNGYSDHFPVIAYFVE
jgi:endonuclease/exonuclease/phosphatase family metal-dependent hydrolase